MNQIAHGKYDKIFKELSEVDYKSQISFIPLDNSKMSINDKLSCRQGSGKMLPSIFKVQKYYVNKQSDGLQTRMKKT